MVGCALREEEILPTSTVDIRDAVHLLFDSGR